MFAGIIMPGKKEMYCEIDCDKLRNLYYAYSKFIHLYSITYSPD